MQIFYTPCKNENLAIALGFFDGVHTAHREILNTAAKAARQNGLKSAVITFRKSPGGYFDRKKNINIQTLDDKLDLISKCGIDYAYVLDFEDYKNLSAQEYLRGVLIENFKPKFIVTGFNHTFGTEKTGNSKFLKENEGVYKYIEVEKLRINNALVSSTNVKKFIEKGYIKEANAMLGYEFNVGAKVEHGLKLAQQLGFKTANLKWGKNIVTPPYGAYFVTAEYNGVLHPAVANFGVKPTIKSDSSPTLEVHILDFDKNIYNEHLRVYFKAPLRPEKKFNTLDELKEAIAKDIETCKKLMQD